MKWLTPTYKVIRSIIMSLIVLVIVVYVGLYILLSVPSVQEKMKTLVCRETSALLGGDVDIDRLSFMPFSEARLIGVSLTSPSGERCAYIGEVAAGIDLWTLVLSRRIVLNYAEVIGLDAEISQAEKDGPLNIQFLIGALSPKDKTRPPSKFDLRFRNVVIRKSKATFTRSWLVDSHGALLPMASLSLSDLRMNLSIPVLKNDDFRFDIRGMQCALDPGVNLRDLSAGIRYRKSDSVSRCDTLFVENLNLKLPGSRIYCSGVKVPLGEGRPRVGGSVSGYVTPSDFSNFIPALSAFDSAWDISLEAEYTGYSVEGVALTLQNKDDDSEISVAGQVAGIDSPDSLDVELRSLRLVASGQLISDVVSAFPKINKKLKGVLSGLGSVAASFSGSLAASDDVRLKGEIHSDAGSLEIAGSVDALKSRRPRVVTSVEGSEVKLGEILSTDKVGDISFSLDADVRGFDKNAEGVVDLSADYIEIGKNLISGLDANVEKHGKDLSLSLSNEDDAFKVDARADCTLDGANTSIDAFVDIDGFSPSSFGVAGKMSDCVFSGSVRAWGIGDNLDNIVGTAYASGLKVAKPDGETLDLKTLSLKVDNVLGSDDLSGIKRRHMSFRSDWMDADVSGIVRPKAIVPEIKHMLADVFPSLFNIPDELNVDKNNIASNEFDFKVLVKGESAPYTFFNLPVRPLSDIPICGRVDTKSGIARLQFATPHIQQGSNKLVSDTRFEASLDADKGVMNLSAGTLYPAKKGNVQLALDVDGMRDRLNAVLRLNPNYESAVKGNIAMDASFSRIPDFFNPSGSLSVHVGILPSEVTINNTVWKVANGMIDYAGKRVAVRNFFVQHANQYVKIDGVASESPDDVLKVKLSDIDLDYIFGILNINYVTFGGMASGEVSGSRLFSKSPVAMTNFLRVRGLSYNNAVLGDGDIHSDFDVTSGKVGIYAVIRDPLTRERRANIDGGIWVTRDSLSFDFEANRVNVQLMKPFVSAFCSDLRGEASGKCKLYGTFKDIDLVGGLRADTISMKLDFTNTWYHAGNDSVFMRKGLIEVPPLTLSDSEGHTAEFSGWLRHTYFHEPVFDFKVRNARSLLCYDTNEKLNPLWYGTIYGSGSAHISGRPGIVSIDMNMMTDENSKFYYVISDTEEVDRVSFLSFTDRRKELKRAEAVDTVPDYLRRFMNMQSEMEEGSSNVVLSLKGSVTPEALVTLVMDPKGGDKITARGQGALQMDYNMAANDLRMFGTYVLDEGNYNFTLQDIIIKNFSIRKGSMIKFDGDPMNADLDIAATYRVNTNLTDLDKSFSSDKELNRTNVPVDALLLVKGPMTQPDISFDIELPSLTSDVERKVKSIVSTNDMMSRQIIYLLALNRFYTPEYTGANSASGAEWSSMASSTISSQLSNILSQMTDKLSVAPSFRSDKGDFTDMEFDLALSSRLLNNRLLINGNFGYRDRATSNTQFVGDFDIEYLLNKNGNLRLKAYNHFNDQNYYLRSALTTQGVGVVYRHDFDRLWRRGPRKKNEKKDSETAPSDSVALPPDSLKVYKVSIENKRL